MPYAHGGMDTVAFQSTLSVRRATGAFRRVDVLHLISIHALRKESDINHAIPQHATIDFNPRSP